jgi:transcriptional regulator with XRE-family HTH domain
MSELQAWMEANGERDETLAPKVKVSRVHMSRLRRGKNRPSLETAKTLQELTGIPATQLMFGEVVK